MKLFSYVTIFLMLVGTGIIATEYGYTAQIAREKQMLGYPVSYGTSGKVMAAAYENGQPRSFMHGPFSGLDRLPGAPDHSVSNRTVVHNSSNVCTTGSCYQRSATCGTTYCRTQAYSNSCGTQYWGYKRFQPARNCIRFFHNRQPIRTFFRGVFGGRFGRGCR